jgi:hypothetical protein
MVKRLVALLVALGVVSAPVALELCQIACDSKATAPSTPHAESHAGHHHMATDHASCHEQAGALQLSPGSVPCDHGGQATPGLVAAKSADAAVARLAVLPLSQTMGIGAARDVVSARQSAWPDHLGVPPVVPLRV